MQRIKNNQLGFGTVELIVAIILVAIGAVGWFVFQNQKKTASSGSSTTTNIANQANSNTTANTADPTAGWVKVTSIGGAYSMKVPDGWRLTNYPGNVLNGDGTIFSAGTPAIITTASSPYAGDQRKFNVGFTDNRSTEGTAPQWQSPSPYGTESVEDFSVGSIKGKRYSIEYTQSVIGVTKGDKIYQYVFDLSSNKGLGVVYMQNAVDPDNLATVEQAIKTITIN